MYEEKGEEEEEKEEGRRSRNDNILCNLEVWTTLAITFETPVQMSMQQKDKHSHTVTKIVTL